MLCRYLAGAHPLVFCRQRLLSRRDGAKSSHDPLTNMCAELLSKGRGLLDCGLDLWWVISEVITQYVKLVANGGSLVPTPLLSVAADLYRG